MFIMFTGPRLHCALCSLCIYKLVIIIFKKFHLQGTKFIFLCFDLWFCFLIFLFSLLLFPAAAV